MHRPIHKQSVCNPKEKRVSPPSDQPETPQLVYGETTLQDEGDMQGKEAIKKRQLDVLVGFEGCIPVAAQSNTTENSSGSSSKVRHSNSNVCHLAYPVPQECFTKLFHPVMAHLRSQGLLRTVIYLDYILIKAEDEKTL